MEQIIKGVLYEAKPEIDGCVGCVADNKAKLCLKLAGDCSVKEVIWYKAPQTKEQIEAKIAKLQKKLAKVENKYTLDVDKIKVGHKVLIRDRYTGEVPVKFTLCQYAISLNPINVVYNFFAEDGNRFSDTHFTILPTKREVVKYFNTDGDVEVEFI